jgi:hypothetical protein
MPIVPPEFPAHALTAMRDGLEAAGRFPRGRGALSLSLPHPVFTAGLEPLAAGQSLAEASNLTAWRALLEEDKRVVAAVEVPVSSDTAAASGASINRGPFVQSTIDGLRLAERDDRIAAARFDISLLRVAALRLVALWLHGPEGDGDVFIPLTPVPSSLTDDAAYDAAQFEREVQRMAKQVPSMYKPGERRDERGSSGSELG